MEKPVSRRLVDAAYVVLAAEGAKGATVRRIEEAAGVPHGSMRHHFGSRAGLIDALVSDLIDDDLRRLPQSPQRMLRRMLGRDRQRTIARYELFLMAARDERLRARVVAARDSLVALVVAAGYAAPQARALVAAIDGLILDGVLRGDRGPEVASLAAIGTDWLDERPQGG